MDARRAQDVQSTAATTKERARAGHDDGAASLRRGELRLPRLLGELRQRAIGSASPAEVVDGRVAERAVEPRVAWKSTASPCRSSRPRRASRRGTRRCGCFARARRCDARWPSRAAGARSMGAFRAHAAAETTTCNGGAGRASTFQSMEAHDHHSPGPTASKTAPPVAHSPTATMKDPVCGMNVDPARAKH